MSSGTEIINSLRSTGLPTYEPGNSNNINWDFDPSNSIAVFTPTDSGDLKLFPSPISFIPEILVANKRTNEIILSYDKLTQFSNIFDDSDISNTIHFEYNGIKYLYDTLYNQFETTGIKAKVLTPWDIGKFTNIMINKTTLGTTVYGINKYTTSYGTNANNTVGIPIYAYYVTSNNDIWIATSVVLNDVTMRSTGDSTKKFKGWISFSSNEFVLGNLHIGERQGSRNPEPKKPSPGDNNGDNIPREDITATDAFEMTEEYQEALYSQDMQSRLAFWQTLFDQDGQRYTLQSHRSIIGLPLQFMGNVDMRVGSSSYGKQFMEDILYDMNIAIIKPGGPVLNPYLGGEYSDSLDTRIAGMVGKVKAYWDELNERGAPEFLKQVLFQLMKSGYSRFYSFQSDYTHYTHYVDTLCHLFITFLGIGEKTYTTASGTVKTYSEYKDDLSEIETDKGEGLRKQFGSDNCVYLYYSDEGSSFNRTFTNTTGQSGLVSSIQTASDATKEWGFFMNAAGIETGKKLANWGQALQSATAMAPNSVISRLFSNATEGVTTILAGNNISLPEIYMDSNTDCYHTFKIKLVSPYGDPESVFLYVLRPLARLLAFSLPRQYGPNSYMSPFIVQAFSKGLFNCQLGIVRDLSITRCGQGGESHTISYIPTELEVSLTISDMYDKVFLSNEFFGNSALKSLLGTFIDTITGSGAGTAVTQFFSTSTATKLLFNNVGLIDFAASFCGFNLNMPSNMVGWTMIWNMMKNRARQYLDYNQNDGWAFPQWTKVMNDAYNDAVTNLKTAITTL